MNTQAVRALGNTGVSSLKAETLHKETNTEVVVYYTNLSYSQSNLGTPTNLRIQQAFMQPRTKSIHYSSTMGGLFTYIKEFMSFEALYEVVHNKASVGCGTSSLTFVNKAAMIVK